MRTRLVIVDSMALVGSVDEDRVDVGRAEHGLRVCGLLVQQQRASDLD